MIWGMIALIMEYGMKITKNLENYDGSSGAMEVHAANILWKRSVEVAKIRYAEILYNFTVFWASDTHQKSVNLSLDDLNTQIMMSVKIALKQQNYV